MFRVLLLSTSKKKRCKVDVGHMFFKNLTVTFLFVSPVEITNSVSASQACNTQCRVIERYWPKVRTSAVIVGHLQ